MAEVYLQSRLEYLSAVQNSDGGWGYFPGKQSWMEPTVYTLLALSGSPGSGPILDRGWRFVRSLQNADGSWRPSSQVLEATWVTALGVLSATCLGRFHAKDQGAIAWLMGVKGTETRWNMRLSAYLHLLKTKADLTHLGWPWLPGCSSWIEPTALTVLALQRIRNCLAAPELDSRICEGQNLILSRRTVDGGWNYGNPNTLNVDSPSYPETTALGLLGLQGRKREEIAGPLAAARNWTKSPGWPLGKAWLTISLRCHGDPAADLPESPPRDIMLCALQALGGGFNWRLLQPRGDRA